MEGGVWGFLPFFNCCCPINSILLHVSVFFFSSLIPNDDIEDSPSSKSDTSDQEDNIDNCNNNKLSRQVEDDDGLKVVSLSSDGSLDTNDSFNSHHHHPLNHQDAIGGLVGIGSSNAHHQANNGSGGGQTPSHNMIITGLNNQQQRRRRKLPEIPKNKKCESRPLCMCVCVSLRVCSVALCFCSYFRIVNPTPYVQSNQ